MKVYYDSEPSKVLYQPLPDGKANVYLRSNICQADRSDFNQDSKNGETQKIWTADEKQFCTSLTKDEVSANFDQLFMTADIPSPTLEERVAVLEAALMEVTANG